MWRNPTYSWYLNGNLVNNDSTVTSITVDLDRPILTNFIITLSVKDDWGTQIEENITLSNRLYKKIGTTLFYDFYRILNLPKRNFKDWVQSYGLPVSYSNDKIRETPYSVNVIMKSNRYEKLVKDLSKYSGH